MCGGENPPNIYVSVLSELVLLRGPNKWLSSDLEVLFESLQYTNKNTYPQNINLFIVDRAFPRSYKSAPRSPPSPLSHCLSFSVFSALLWVAIYQWSPVELIDGRGMGGGCGRGAKLYDRPWESLAIYKSFNTLREDVFITINIRKMFFIWRCRVARCASAPVSCATWTPPQRRPPASFRPLFSPVCSLYFLLQSASTINWPKNNC